MATARLFQSGNRKASSTMKKTISILSTTAALTLFASAVVFAAGPPADTSTTISFSPAATVPQFSAASATVTVTSGGAQVTSGTVTLYAAKTAGVAGSCTTQNGNAEVQPALLSASASSGQVVFDLQAAGLTTTVGTIGYIAVFDDPGNYKKSAAACLDFTVVPGVPSSDPACQDGQNAAISATYVNSPGFPLPGTYTWNLLLSVHACKNLTDVSAQGGSNAWTGSAYGAPTQGSVGTRKATGGNNAVSIWSIGSMTSGQTVTLPTSVTGTIKPKTACGTVLGLLGSWSALSTSVEFGAQKSTYTGSSTVTVGPSPCVL
jgi:hypothetical protein